MSAILAIDAVAGQRGAGDAEARGRARRAVAGDVGRQRGQRVGVEQAAGRRGQRDVQADGVRGAERGVERGAGGRRAEEVDVVGLDRDLAQADAGMAVGQRQRASGDDVALASPQPRQPGDDLDGDVHRQLG